MPDFAPELRKVLTPDLSTLDILSTEAESRSGKKNNVWVILAVFILLLSLIVFACVFSIKLIPTAFPPKATVMLTETPTQTVSETATPLPTHTALPTLTPLPTVTPKLDDETNYFGDMTGNVWAHQGPDLDSERIPLVVDTNTKVELKAMYDNWAKITWETEFGTQEGWVPMKFIGIPFDPPILLITPVK